MDSTEEDTRTPEQHMSDVARATRARLERLADELDSLGVQLFMLGNFAGTRGNDAEAEQLLMLSQAAAMLADYEIARQPVLDLQASLPSRMWIPPAES